MTHGFCARPRSTAFLASRPAPSITDGFEVFVQLVIAAITTEPWPSSNSLPSSVLTTACAGSASATAVGAPACGSGSPSASMLEPGAGGSLAGNDSHDASSGVPFAGLPLPLAIISLSAAWYDSAASVSATRSCGRFGPARLGSTVARSSSSVSE